MIIILYNLSAFLEGLGIEIEGFHGEAVLHEVARHGKTHVTETDETYFLKEKGLGKRGGGTLPEAAIKGLGEVVGVTGEGSYGEVF